MSSDTESSTANNHAMAPVLKALKNNDPKADVLKPYLSAARWIPLAINPYANLTAVFFTALEEEGIQGHGEEDLEQSSEIDKTEELRIFSDIMKLVPSFKDVVMACSDHQRALVNLMRMIQDASNSARNDDIAKTNASIVDYISLSGIFSYSLDEFPLPGKNDYSERGWNHPEYASLLYPQALLDHLNSESLTDIMHEAEHGMIDISECEWPAFLYPLGTSPDVEDDQLGLFRGYLLVRVFRQIFTGPRSALKPESGKKGRSCKARLHNLTNVTGRTIAYVCIVVETRIALRGLGWTIDDGAFEYGVFYQNIVRMFEDNPQDPWVEETLAWWNQQVPGLPSATAGSKRRPKNNKSGIEGRIMDPIARRAAQRAAKALNLAAAQPPAPSLLTAGRESEAPAVSGDAALQPARGQLGSEMAIHNQHDRDFDDDELSDITQLSNDSRTPTRPSTPEQRPAVMKAAAEKKRKNAASQPEGSSVKKHKAQTSTRRSG